MARNTSDSIEEYIKELLGQSGIAEIQRSNLADTFQVVPSMLLRLVLQKVVVILLRVNVEVAVIFVSSRSDSPTSTT